MTVNPADGLVRPLNAPQGQQVLPGVQPGVTGGVVLATYVIIFGTNGGMFVYNGSPGPGNAPVFSISNATSDPYGNAIAPGIWAGQFGSTQAGLEVQSGVGQLAFPVAGTSPAKVGGIVGRLGGLGFGGSVLEMFSAQDSAPNNDRVFMQMDDLTATNTSAAYFIGYQDPTPFGNVHMQGGAAGLALSSVSGIAGVLPGTGTAITNQAQPETWHTATLINGWAGSSGVGGIFYRLLPLGPSGSNVVEVIGDIINAGGAGANTVAATLPSGYRPATGQNHGAAVNNPQANNSASFPWINVATGGNIQVTGLQAVDSTAEVFFHIFIPLGTL